MSEEKIIINGEPFYIILNGTSYDYAPIPKEFKPYFERILQENQQLKEKYNIRSKAYNNILLENVHLKSVLDEIRECVKGNYVIDNPVKFKNDIWDILDKVKK